MIVTFWQLRTLFDMAEGLLLGVDKVGISDNDTGIRWVSLGFLIAFGGTRTRAGTGASGDMRHNDTTAHQST